MIDSIAFYDFWRTKFIYNLSMQCDQLKVLPNGQFFSVILLKL